MKTTNFDISQKLAEIGFSGINWDYFYWEGCPKNPRDARYCYDCDEIDIWLENGRIYPAYDLETILEALPEKIKIDNSPHSPEWLSLYKTDIGYGSMALPEEMRIRVDTKEDESLADTAALLLLKLVEAGIVKFNN